MTEPEGPSLSAIEPPGGKRLVRRVVRGGVLLLAAAGAWWLVVREPADEPEGPFVAERYILPQEPITQVPVKPVAEVKDRLKPADLVLGVALGDQARAYPINVVNFHPQRKVLNDVLGGRPLVVTWCDASHTGVVYDPTVEGHTAVLAVSGQLWKDNQVFYDLETHSLFCQFQGQAKLGARTGTRLRPVPSVLTDWQSWLAEHPTTTVAWFDGKATMFTTAMYDNLHRFVLGIGEGRKGKAWTFERLGRSGVVNDAWQGKPVVAVLEPASKTARLYNRQVGDRTLTFHLADEGLVDEETGTTWAPISGKAISGPLVGQTLSPLPAVTAFRDVWLRFYPRSL